LVPQGGNTGLVGGGVPLANELLLSLTRLDRLEPVDDQALQVTAEAGVTIGRLQDHAQRADLAYGVDLAARDSATLGGTIATNAGGIHLLRFGGTRQQLLGVRAVLADGSTVSHLDGLPKDNTGYDLADLLCGSEGTLGVVTAARVRLVPHHANVVVALLAFGSVADAVAGVAATRRLLGCLNAAELMFRDGMQLVASAEQLPDVFSSSHPVYVLLEAADHVDPVESLNAVVGAIPRVLDSAVAVEPARRAELWRYREGHTSAINGLGPPHKLDVTLPLARLADFVDQVRLVVEAVEPSAKVWLFGHVADGNVHVNITGVDESDDRVDDAVLELVASYGGSISAEHGIGTAKKRWLHLNRSRSEIDAFRRIKGALDPNSILNPHVLLP
jgi:FAD/FMN-containing dehydrogenase